MNFRDWYCVHVASGCENKARADLMARKEVIGDRYIKNVECPEVTEMIVDKGGRRRTMKRKILPGYIIVQVDKEIVEDEEGNTTKVFPTISQDVIMSTFNVLGFAGPDKNKPRMMKPKEVENIFNLVDDTHLEVKQNALTQYQEGDILDVVSGPFAGYKMEVASVQGDKILGQLDMFGRIVPAEFSKDQVYKK